MGVCGWGGVHAADPQLAQWIVLSHLRDHHRHHGLPLSRGWSCRRVAKTACFCKPATSHNLHTETNLLKFTEFSLLHTEKIQLSATLFLFVRTCRMAAFALLAGVAVSFAPPMAVARAGVSTPTTQLAHLAAAPRAAPPAMSAVGALRVAAAMPTLYALMSVNEYMTHRWYQHAEFNKEPLLQKLWCMLTFAKVAPKIRGGGHVEHHAETYDDMSLKKDERWLRTPAAKSLDSDVFRGTAFSWKVTALMCIQMLPTTLPAFALLGFSLPATFALFFPAMALHGAMWNALHPPMHGEPTFLRGLPFSCFEPLFSRFFSCVFSFFFSSPPPPPPSPHCTHHSPDATLPISATHHSYVLSLFDRARPRPPLVRTALPLARLAEGDQILQVHLPEPHRTPRARRTVQLQRVLPAHRPSPRHVCAAEHVGAPDAPAAAGGAQEG